MELIVDPHKTDFFVISIKAYILGRKPLLKYSRTFDGYRYTVCPYRFFGFIDFMHARLWNILFSKKYGFSLTRLTQFDKNSAILYHTLPSVNSCSLGELNFVYFSHAYLYARKLEWLARLSSVNFVAENRVMSSVLAKKFGITQVLVQPFKLRDEILKQRTSGLFSTSTTVLITGTFHTNEGNMIFNNRVSKVWGVTTLHEVRQFITEMGKTELIPNLKICTNELIQTNAFNAVLNGRQRDYFRVNIVEQMLAAKYIIIDIEVLTDIIPINFAEGIILGAVPVVPRRLIEIEELYDFQDAMIIYEDKIDLLEKLRSGLGEVNGQCFLKLQNYILYRQNYGLEI